jgi:hypothetical protein
LLEIDTSVIKFRKAETLRGQYPIETRRVDRTRRTMTTPRATSYLVELVPIAFLPSRHCGATCGLPSIPNCGFYL